MPDVRANPMEFISRIANNRFFEWLSNGIFLSFASEIGMPKYLVQRCVYNRQPDIELLI